METLVRYSVLDSNMPREFILLQGRGCKWRKCIFCDYHNDVGNNSYFVNLEVLERVTGVYGVLDVINSGSAMELDDKTVALIRRVAMERGIHTLLFEAHWMYRYKLAEFAEQFAPIDVKFRCGVESFDPKMRENWKKGISPDVTPADIAKYFKGVCLLCCTDGDSKERILSDIATAKEYFEYFSINLFCNNGTSVKRDEELAKWFEQEVYPTLEGAPGIEVLLNNTDLGVG